jgi:hypothetical protein
MVEDAGQIREAIEQTRDDIGHTLQAIGYQVDVKARTSGLMMSARRRPVHASR